MAVDDPNWCNGNAKNKQRSVDDPTRSKNAHKREAIAKETITSEKAPNPASDYSSNFLLILQWSNYGGKASFEVDIFIIVDWFC